MEKELREIYMKSKKEREERINNDIRTVLEKLFDNYCKPELLNIKEIAKKQSELRLFSSLDPIAPSICGQKVYINQYLRSESHNPSNQQLLTIMKEIIKEKKIPLTLKEKGFYSLYFEW